MINKLTALLLICLSLSTLFCGCVAKSEEPGEYIGIISAMDNEIDLLLKEAMIDRVDTVADVKYHVGSLHGQPVVITRSGIGKIRAASGVTTMLNTYPISKVIFTGIAGCVADEPQVLDEVIATNLVEHDYGIFSNDGFEWRSGDPGFGNEPGVYYECDPELVQLAYDAAVTVIGKDHVFKGTVATGDQFIANSEYVQKLQSDYDAYPEAGEQHADENDPKDTFSPCWMLNLNYTGKGYAYEAAHAFFDYLFNEKGARRIYAYTEDYNTSSQHLCERLGMRREGLFMEFISFVNNPDGTPHYENTYEYAILKKSGIKSK